LWQTCARGAKPTSELKLFLSKELHAGHADVEAFISALNIPEDPLPRRKEITDIGIRRTANLLKKYRPASALSAESCYRYLATRIANSGTDVPETEADPGPTVAATLAMVAANRKQARLMRQYLSARQILDDLLRIHDHTSASSLPEAGQQGWEPDAHFTGRSSYLTSLARMLRPGSLTETSPVVIHGIPGCGKTSLAAQFAALHRDVFRPIFINASSRTALIQDLSRLARQVDTSRWDTGIAELRGPTTPTLPGNSATLLLIDGVTDPETIRGIVPRRSLCRVLITSATSHIDQGYEHLHLPCWSRPESDSFISKALPEESQESRDKLAAALNDHPLGITQAANYCRVTGRAVSDYITRLEREPVLLLDQGRASGHLDSVVKTIKLSVDAAKERWPDCDYLMNLLAHLGSAPLDESIFERKLATSYVSSPEPSRQDYKSASRRFQGRLFRKHDTGNPGYSYRVTSLSSSVGLLLRNGAWRDRAVDALLMTSLVTRRDTGLVVHPLIARVVRQLAGDPRPWLELGFGVFAELMAPGVEKEFRTLDPYLDHVSALASTALREQFTGPAVLAACHFLARRMGQTGGNGTTLERGLTAVQFGRYALEIAQEHVRMWPSHARMVAETRRALALAHFTAGQLGNAMSELRNYLEFGHSQQDDAVLVDAILDLSSLAAAWPSREIAERFLCELESEDMGGRLTSASPLAIAHAKSCLLRRLGRIHDAAAHNQVALNLAADSGCTDSLRVEVYQTAAQLARDRNDGPSVLRNALPALAIKRQSVSERQDIQFLAALTFTADAAIEAGDLGLAETLIDEAEGIARATFGPDSIAYADVLAERGRLRLHQRRVTDSFRDLEDAVNLLNAGSDIDQANLPAALVHLAHASRILGDRQKARRCITEAYEIDLAKFGPDHPETIKDMAIMRDMGIRFG
jgi:tetratricopeptide (TPR) repeat protein